MRQVACNLPLLWRVLMMNYVEIMCQQVIGNTCRIILARGRNESLSELSILLYNTFLGKHKSWYLFVSCDIRFTSTPSSYHFVNHNNYGQIPKHGLTRRQFGIGSLSSGVITLSHLFNSSLDIRFFSYFPLLMIGVLSANQIAQHIE